MIECQPKGAIAALIVGLVLIGPAPSWANQGDFPTGGSGPTATTFLQSAQNLQPPPPPPIPALPGGVQTRGILQEEPTLEPSLAPAPAPAPSAAPTAVLEPEAVPSEEPAPELLPAPDPVPPGAPQPLLPQSPLPATDEPVLDLVQKIQAALAARGYEPGPADGVMGARTRDAILQFQGEAGLPQDGEPSLPLYQAIQTYLPPAGEVAALPVPAPAILPSPVPAARDPALAALGRMAKGPARVIDTGSLEVLGRPLTLIGVLPRGEPQFVQAMAGYIAAQGGWVRCDPVAPGHYRCVTRNGFDVGEAAILNGAAQASGDAPALYHEAERKARARRVGIWR